METVLVKPVPGFCIKSRVDEQLTASDERLGRVEKGLKVFVNVAWDENVPPPPPASDDAVRRAMHGLDDDDDDWFVPIVLADVRQDTDKAGSPAVVFDCVLNPLLKSRCLRDREFKNFVIELALQRVESQAGLVLSRQIGTPNIASKGKPRSRRVHVPIGLFPLDHPNRQAAPPLVEEIHDRPVTVPNPASPKGIPKNPPTDPRIPIWFCTRQGPSVRIVFVVPGITRAIIPDATLDIEPRRIILHIPDLYGIDINLDSPDSELVSIFGKNETADEALKLKRMRPLDVDDAKAAWHIADETITLLA